MLTIGHPTQFTVGFVAQPLNKPLHATARAVTVLRLVLIFMVLVIQAVRELWSLDQDTDDILASERIRLRGVSHEHRLAVVRARPASFGLCMSSVILRVAH